MLKDGIFLIVGGNDLLDAIFFSNILRYYSSSFGIVIIKRLLSTLPLRIELRSFLFSNFYNYSGAHLSSKESSSFLLRFLYELKSHSVLLDSSTRKSCFGSGYVFKRLLRKTVALLRLLPACSSSSSLIFNLLLTFSFNLLRDIFLDIATLDSNPFSRTVEET